MTNYEKIKSMNVDDAAEFIGYALMICKRCPRKRTCVTIDSSDCYEVIRERHNQKVRKIK